MNSHPWTRGETEATAAADGTARLPSNAPISLDAAERRMPATMPLHAITSVHGEAGLRERLLIETDRLPAADRPRTDGAFALMSLLHAGDRRQREPYACHPLRVAIGLFHTTGPKLPKLAGKHRRTGSRSSAATTTKGRTADARHHPAPQRAGGRHPRDTNDDWKQISLAGDYGAKISLSAEQLRALATVILSGEFALITGLQGRRPPSAHQEAPERGWPYNRSAALVLALHWP